MEKAANVYVMLSQFQWSDLGTWASLHEASPKDQNNNFISADAITYDTRNSYIKGPKDKLMIVQGLNGYLVGWFNDVVVICEKEKEELFKRIVNDLKEKNNGAGFL
jgi:mannose-1-phosphate guanylyltransferase